MKNDRKIRAPIVTLVGHVDHGKSSILDYIKHTNIVSQEAGGITQKISSTSLAISEIRKITGRLLHTLNIDLTIPGILFIDTPGHAAFNNLRKRGGNLADIAILVVDIKEGVMPQTIESIEILKSYKTPFIIALNKIDTLPGWRPNTEIPLIKNIQLQSEITIQEIEKRLYNLVAKLGELSFNAERFDRIENYTKQISIIPCSAKTGEGIPELLMVMTGLAQKYLEESLKIEVKGFAKGTILEIREEKGLGKILDTIIYDGTVKKNDTLVIATLSGPIVTKVKAIFQQKKGKRESVEEVSASAGIIISAQDIEQATAGMPLQTAGSNLDEVKQTLQEEIQEVLIETEKDGVILKADTLGSLEALTNLLKDKNIPIKKADIGEITKKDMTEAKSEKKTSNRVILGFNVKNQHADDIKIITNNVIYRIIEEYDTWIEQTKKNQEQKELSSITYPAKIQIIRGTIFRQSNPAVVGVRILEGKLRANTPLIREDGVKIGEVKSLQLEGETIQEAIRNKEVAISLPGVTVGRQVEEEMVLYADISEEEFVKLKKLKSFLNRNEIEVLKEIANIKRTSKPLWGI